MYARFKAFCRQHEISVGTMAGLLGFIGYTASSVVSAVGGYDYTGLPTWAQAAIGAGLLALTAVGRFAIAFAKWLGQVPPAPQLPPSEPPVP